MIKSNDTLTYDSRLVERNLRKGTLSRKDLDSHLQKLSDQTENFEIINVVEMENEILKQRHSRRSSGYDRMAYAPQNRSDNED